jgi:hypothetical protein
MKFVLYSLCLISMICLLVMCSLPNDFNGTGGRYFMTYIVLLVAIALSSPLLTFIYVLNFFNVRDRGENLQLAGWATALAAFPGVWLLINVI